MKFRKNIKIMAVLILILTISLIGCGESTKDKLDNNLEDNNVGQDENQDRELTDELLNEKEVSGGQIYSQGEWIIGAIIIKDGITQERGKAIAEEYAEKLKEKYPDKKINVQAILDGENIANIEL